MTKTRAGWAGLALGLVALWTLAAGGGGGSVLARQQAFALQPNDHISIIGNTLAERMQYDGWLETMLQARFPKHELVIRNLGFSGDEINTRPRSKNFGTPDEWLSGLAQPIGGYEDNRFAGTNTKADVVFAFFGYNESYAGQAGLEAFKKELGAWIAHTLAQKYNGRSAPRVVLFSPIAHEDLGNPDLPDGKAEQRAPGALHQGDGRGGAHRQHHVRRSLHAERQALRRHQGAAHDSGRPPEHRRQPPDRAGHRPHALRRLAEASGGPADQAASGSRRQGQALVPCATA